MEQVKKWLLAGWIAVMLSGVALADDFQEGVEAYEEGNYATAFAKFDLLAEGGNPRAQFNLGLLYDNGEGVKKDAKKAFDLWLMAAKNGHIGAQYNLGLKYIEGDGVPQNNAEAAKWFDLAARSGNALAQFNLALLYVKGEGVRQDYTRAYMWFDFAATHESEVPEVARIAGENRDKLKNLFSTEQLIEAQTLGRRAERLSPDLNPLGGEPKGYRPS